MTKPYPLLIGSRYLRARTRNRFVSFISLISILGIAVAVAVLIVVLSVMNGFEYEVRDRILDVLSHAAITTAGDGMDDWRLASALAESDPDTKAVSAFIGGEALLIAGDVIKGAQLRGVDPQSEVRVADLEPLMVAGRLDDLQSGAYRLVIGRSLADLLRVRVGDRLIMMVSQGVTTPAGLVPRMRRFEIAGIFYAGMYEYDRGLVFLHRDDASRLLRMGDSVTGLRLAMVDPENAPSAVRAIAQRLGQDVYITDWTRQHANFFRSIQLTKSIIFVILLMVVAVAAFNIVSTLVMVVREKRADVAILRTLGASPRGILTVFMTQGTLIGVLGTTVGVLLGLIVASNIGQLVAWFESLSGIQILAPDVYFISEFPSRVEWLDVGRVAGIALLLALLSTVYPAWRAAATPPATALRHE